MNEGKPDFVLFRTMCHAVGVPDAGGVLEKEQAVEVIAALVRLVAYVLSKTPHPDVMMCAVFEQIEGHMIDFLKWEKERGS